VPLLVLGLPLLDTGLAVVRRLVRLSRKGRREENGIRYMLGHLNQVFLPDRGHIHHRLIDLGLSHRGAVLILYVVGLLFACAAFALVLLKSLFIAALLLGVLILLMASFLLLVYLRIRRPGRIAENLKNKGKSAATAADPLTSSSGRVQSR
jgi:UDP-GlcNAc:undecaprenyl-phosphate GlcNAc-1-phosphate transferase